MNFTLQPADGFAFCSLVPAGPNRVQCFAALGYEILYFGRSGTEREKLCARVQGEDQIACRFGAGLSATPPVGLPRAEGPTPIGN